MSYVPPHLRNGVLPHTPLPNNVDGQKPLSDTKDRAVATAPRFSRSSSAVHPAKNSDPSVGRRGINGFSVPEPIFPQWKPSERVLRLTPEQIEEVRLRLNVDVTIPADATFCAPAPIETFTDMCLHPSIMKDVTFHDYTRPTPIQAQAMPIALSGKDLLGCAETGSGKTAAFSIPMIQHCLAQTPIQQGDGPLALVLAPTRELAQQIEKEVKAFSRSLDGFRTAIVVGGTNIVEQATSAP